MYSITLWDALKFEILNAQEDDLSEEALTALEAISRQLSLSAHTEALETYLRPIAKECNEHLEDTPTKQSTASSRILKAVSQGSQESSNLISLAVLPQVFAFYKSADSLPRRRGLLEVLNAILQANLVVFSQWRRKETSRDDVVASHSTATLRPTPNGLVEFNETAARSLTIALTATPIKEVSFRLLVLETLRNLAMIKQVLDEASITQVVRTLDDIVIKEESFGKDELKAAAIDALVELAQQKPQLLIEIAFPDFMAQLPDTDAGSDKPYVPVLEAFAKLSVEPQVFKTVILRLKNKFYAAARQDASTKYLMSILSAILHAFLKGSPNLQDPALFGVYYQDIVVNLLKDARTIGGALRSCTNVQQPVVLDLIGRICNAIVRTQPWVAQTEICRNVYTMFQPVELSAKAPFNVQDPKFQDMLISTHLLAALQREAKPHTDLQELLTATIAFASDDKLHSQITHAATSQISLLVNKFIPNTETTAILSAVSALLPNSTATSTPPNPQSITIAFSILHAAILRTHRTVFTLLQTHILPLLSTPTGPTIAHHLSTLLAPSTTLTKENHCQIFTLHKQRLFALTVPNLVATFRATETTAATKRSILVALSGLLYYIPYELLRAQKEELENLVPLLLQSLTLTGGGEEGSKDDATSVRQRSITLIERIVHDEDSRAVLSSHVASLVNRLLDIATGVASTPTGTDAGASAEGIPSLAKPGKAATRNADPVIMPTIASPTAFTANTTPKSKGSRLADPPNTRAAALATLTSFPISFPPQTLLPLKATVIKRLITCLDDRRRVVRGEGVRCRRAWEGGDMGGGGGGGSDED